MKRAEYKIPGGKLLAAEVQEKGGKLTRVKLVGDFFMHPEEAIDALEAALRSGHVAAAGLDVVPVEPPVLTAERSGDRLIVRVIPGPGAELLTLKIRASTDLHDPRLNGRPITLASQPDAWSTLTYHAPDPNGVTLSFTSEATGRLEADVMEMRDGWPAEAAPPAAKPPELMATGMSDKTAVLAHARLAWG